MNYDFNTADPQEDRSELIPPDTIAKMKMMIRTSADFEDEPFLTQSKTTEAKYLNCEFTISSGKHNKRKFWMNIMMDGVSDMAKNISRSTLRAILESARQIDPLDASDSAVQARHVGSLEEFCGMEFVGKVGLDKAKPNSGYDDKNNLALAITPDKPEYKTIMNGGEIDGKPVAKPVQQAGFNAGSNNPNTQTGGITKWGQNQSQPPAATPEPAAKPVPAWAQ